MIKQTITWRSKVLPLPNENKISNPVLCSTSKGFVVLHYDHIFQLWSDPQKKAQAFKGEVFKWCEIKN